MVLGDRHITDIPAAAADTNNDVSAGKVVLKRKEIAQLIGKVFIQKSAVNLLSTVLDTPEFFWSAPDNMQVSQLIRPVALQPPPILAERAYPSPVSIHPRRGHRIACNVLPAS